MERRASRVADADDRPILRPIDKRLGPLGRLTWLCGWCGVHLVRGVAEDYRCESLIECPNCWELNELTEAAREAVEDSVDLRGLRVIDGGRRRRSTSRLVSLLRRVP